MSDHQTSASGSSLVPRRILVIRPDRIGDVVLSTPVFEALKGAYPQARVTVLVRALVVPVLTDHSFIDDLIVFEPEGEHAGAKGFSKLVRKLKGGRFDVALALQSHPRVAAAVFAARIPVRIGPRSKPHSYFFYNQSVRQKRSAVEKHEADYNLDLLAPLGIQTPPRELNTRIGISEAAGKQAETWLREAFGADSATGFVAIHAGMGGSALNWPEERYAELARDLLDRGVKVVFTGGPGEEGLLDRMRERVGSGPSVAYFGGRGGPGIDVLAAVFGRSGVTVAPSTGPLHLAVAMGAPVVSFYPPIRVQSPKRWGPYVSERAQAAVLVPQVECGASFSCLGPKCKDFPCMEGLTVERALEEVLKLLDSGSNGRQGGNPNGS